MYKEPIVFDKAKYHFESVEEHDLPEIHAYIHTGLYLGWLIETNLLSQEFIDDFGQKIPDFLQRKITAPELFSLWDGVLADDMLNDEGIEFSKHYFDFENGKYIHEYIEVLAQNLNSEFHVKDNWENYEKVKAFVSRRHKGWLKTKNKSWWQFWR